MTIYIFDDFCIERVTGRGHNISDLCCKVFVGIHTFYESRTVVESRYIDGQQINSLSGYSEAGIRNIYVNRTVQVYILLPYWSLPGVVCCSSGSVCAMLTLFSDQIGVNQLASHDDWLIIYNDPRLQVTEAPLLLLSHYVLAPTTGKYFVFWTSAGKWKYSSWTWTRGLSRNSKQPFARNIGYVAVSVTSVLILRYLSSFSASFAILQFLS